MQERSTFSKWRALPVAHKFMVIETLFWLGLARVLVVAFSFQRIGRLASGPVRPSEAQAQKRAELIPLLARLIPACARRVPWRAKCYETGLTAHFMLRRRGVGSTLFYGVTPKGGEGLGAHVWVRSGDQDVVGCETARQYAVLATFPAMEKGGS